MRAVGIDLGERRIGVAVSDSRGVLATPYSVVERSGDVERDRLAIAGVVSEVGGEILVVGMPLSLSGARGPAALAAEAEVYALREVVKVPVVTFDERLTTVQASRLRRERATSRGVARSGGGGTGAGSDRRGTGAGGGRGTGASGRGVARAGNLGSNGSASPSNKGSRAGGRSVSREGIDAEAAAVMLAAWLEGRH